jgi:hypothetical protein
VENDVYMCWGEADKVELELEPLDRKCETGGAGWGHPAKTYPNAFALPASPTTILSTAFPQQMLVQLRKPFAGRPSRECVRAREAEVPGRLVKRRERESGRLVASVLWFAMGVTYDSPTLPPPSWCLLCQAKTPVPADHCSTPALPLCLTLHQPSSTACMQVNNAWSGAAALRNIY